MTTGLETEARVGRLARRVLVLGALALAGSTAFLTWWTTTLMGLPDVGDPFDVAAFERPIPDETNAFVLYRQAAALLAKEPPEVVDHWSKASPTLRSWLESSRDALEIWRRGTERPDALDVLPGDLTFEANLAAAQNLRILVRLAVLQGTKLEGEGDLEGALDWYLALLRSSRHCGRRGVIIERIIGMAIHRWAFNHLTRWAADPKVDSKLLRRALDAADAATAPISDGLKAEYLSFLHSLADPELMLRTYDSLATQTSAGGSATQWPLRWSPNVNRVRRRALNEPERSRRVVRLVFANWLAYCDRPPNQRPPKVLPNPTITGKDPAKALLADLFVVDATAPEGARALPPEKVAAWFASTIDAEMALPAFSAVENALASERSLQGNLLVTLANELHKREHGKYPDRVEDLVGPYLKVLPEGYAPAK